jgi:hypothetical protein
MHGLPLEQQILLFLQTAALLGLTVRLIWNKLFRVYSAFFTYLLAALLQTAILFFVPFDSKNYVRIWMATEASITCIYLLVVLETYSIVLRDYRGLAITASRYMLGALLIAITISCLFLGVEKVPQRGFEFFGYFMRCDRVTLGSLTIFVLFLTVFLLYFPISVRQNALVYSIGFAVYLLTKSAGFLITNMTRQWAREVNATFVAASTGCLFLWLLTLSQKGEQRAVAVGHAWRPQDEARLLAYLDEINVSLLSLPGKRQDKEQTFHR